MTKQNIVWTVLPKGIGTTGSGENCLQFSVFVSPRLDPNPNPHRLDQFPDFSNWPEKVNTMTFQVEFDNGSTLAATLDNSPLDPPYWGVLFKDDTYVRPYEYRDFQHRILRTYPLKGVLSYMKSKYVTVGEKSPGSLPLVQPHRDDEGNPIEDMEATLDKFITELGDLLEGEKEDLFQFDVRYIEAIQAWVDAGEKKLLSQIFQENGYPLSKKAKILKLDEYNWKITDGSKIYYIETKASEQKRWFNVYRYGDVYSGLDKELEKSKVLDPSKTYGFTKEKLDFLQAARFYDRREDAQAYHFKPNVKVVPPSPEVPEIDFHQMLATLGDHPVLMRKLGLVLDFTIPVPEQSFSSIRLVLPPDSAALLANFNRNLTPWTRCIFSNTEFLAQPKSPGKLKSGMLDLADTDDNPNSSSVYSLVQVDPDGAALKTVDAAKSIKGQIKKKYILSFPKEYSKMIIRDCALNLDTFMSYSAEESGSPTISAFAKVSKIAAGKWIINDMNKIYEIHHTGKDVLNIYEKMEAAYDTPEDAGLPALHSAGIVLAKTGRAFDLHTHFKAAFLKNQDLEANNPAVPVDLYADDLVRGYRVDILDLGIAEPTWRSLCQRVGTYSFPGSGAEAIPVDDEGYVKGASTTSSDAKDSDVYLHEAVFRWDGWSLCAQRPGKTIVSETREEKELLFNWDDVPANNKEFLDFLENYLHARWARGAVIQKPDSNTITVADSENQLTFTLKPDKTIIMETDDGVEYEYFLKEVGGKSNVYTAVVKQDEKPGLTTNKAETKFGLETVFSAKPFSLPRLRFGHRYRLRARVVDIAGNSIELDCQDDSLATQTLYYKRYEPLIPPTLVPRARLTEGESVERMVIRSNFAQSAVEYVQADHVKKVLLGKDYTYEEGNERHVVPPKTSQIMAETHGEFDEYFGEGKDYKKGYNIALKERGTLTHTKIVNIVTGEEESIPNPASVEVTGEYVIHKEDWLLLPYLPDPIGQGVVFRNLPGLAPGGTGSLEKIIDPGLNLELLKVPFDLDWPDAQPFRIRIEERLGEMVGDSCDETFVNTGDPPAWDPVNHILTVYLAKAQVARIRYSCYMSSDDLEKMGIWHWLKGSGNIYNLRKYALAGSHWMLTPYRELVLVHAVQQPLCEPTVPELAAIKKQIGDTFASIKGKFHLSVKSTGKVDLLAHWTEPVDDLLDEAPKTIDVNARVFEVKIEESFKDTITLPLNPCIEHRHEFGDTKYRRVKYYLQGATRFREYFHPDIAKPVEFCFRWDELPGADNQQIIDVLKETRNMDFTGSAAIEKSADGEAITVTENGNSVNIRLNQDRNAIILTEGTKEYVYGLKEKNVGEYCIITDRITRWGLVREADVYNSARPAAPKVLYIVPTFGWEEKKDPQVGDIWMNFQRKRIGGGLRVYLDRPWFSSGDGELLGVILYPHFVTDEGRLKTFVTRWGMDPIRDSKIPRGVLSKNDFVNFAGSQEGLSLEELAAQKEKVNVVGFKPEFNRERQLWYCDVQFDPAEVISYYPFVRLALARYQPKSIPDAHLSRVVLTDFVQVANDRTLSIKFYNDDKKFDISVIGYGTGNRASNRVEVSIEVLPAGGNEELGWQVVKGTAAQPNPFTLEMAPVDVRNYLWKWYAGLKLPGSRRSKRYRLVVREYELFKADGDIQAPYIEDIPPDFKTKDEERLVYIDIVEVSPVS